MAYTKTTWLARVGTALNRFLKTNETETSVELTNDPTGVSTAGTPFTVDNMNKIEQGIYDAHEAMGGNFTQLDTDGSPTFASLSTGFINQHKPTTWAQLGNSFDFVSLAYPAVCSLSSTKIALIESNSDELRTYEWDGTDWAQVGNGLAIATMGLRAKLCTLNSTTIAFIDDNNDELRTYEWDGTDWAQVGNGLAIATISDAVLCSLSSTKIALIESNSDELRTYEWDGTDWAQVGNGLAIAIGRPAICSLSSTTIAFIDSTNDELRTYEWDGTDWIQVGSGISVTIPNFPSACTINSNTIVITADTTESKISTYHWNGSTWSRVGSVFPISGGNLSGLASLSEKIVAHVDDGNKKLRTYELSFSEFPPNPAFGTL